MMTTQPYQICTKLVMDTSDPSIAFDDNGVCNHFHDFQNNVKLHWHPNPEGYSHLQQTVEVIKES